MKHDNIRPQDLEWRCAKCAVNLKPALVTPVEEGYNLHNAYSHCMALKAGGRP